MKKIGIIIALFTLSATGYAQVHEVQGAKVTGVYCGIYGGKNMCSVYLNKELSIEETCSTYKHRFMLSAESDIGKAMLSIALSAHAQGKEVMVRGSKACTIHHDSEDLDVIFIQPKCSETFNTYGCI